MKRSKLIKRTKNNFRKAFKQKPAQFFQSPGRIELIGNHLDHQGGKTVSLTIDRYIYAVSSKTHGTSINVINDGHDLLTKVALNIKGVNPKTQGMSRALIEGVIVYFKKHGYKVGALNVSLAADLPQGAGLSSSAAYSVLFAKLLSFYYNEDSISELELAKAAQYAESVHFGKPCGLLDQVSIAFGGLVFSDFKDDPPHIRNFHKNLPKLRFFVVDTGESHDNLTAHYEAIRTDMAAVSAHYNAKRLREVNINAFQASLLRDEIKVSKRALNRVSHYFREMHRVTKFQRAYRAGDNREMKKLVQQSGESSAYVLENLTYEGDVSKLLLTHYEILKKKFVTKVLGGGFAGALLVVIRENVLERDIIKHYRTHKVKVPAIHIMNPELNGTRFVANIKK